MARLIDADALKKKYTMVIKRTSPNAIMERPAILLEDVETAPTIDAEPIRHGKWMVPEKSDFNWECSKCGYGIMDCKLTYCPNCGAKMEEVEE